MFRSPTLFEDIVKTITGCNVTWPNTMRMNVRCFANTIGGGGFPTPGQLAAGTGRHSQTTVQGGLPCSNASCGLATAGSQRVNWIWTGFEDPAHCTAKKSSSRLKLIYGIGDYAAGNICQLLGRYDRLAIDTETYRHFRQAYGISRRRQIRLKLHDRIEKHYAQYRAVSVPSLLV